MRNTSCNECEAIIVEYRRACIDFWLNASDETREACRAIGQLVAWCREADADHAQELLRPFKPSTFESKMNPRAGLLEAYVGSGFDQRIAELAYRKLQHQFKSGHYVSFRFSPPPDPS